MQQADHARAGQVHARHCGGRRVAQPEKVPPGDESQTLREQSLGWAKEPIRDQQARLGEK
jgi:hypothetical protein